MNIIFLPITCLVSLILAEPPVGDGYPAAHLSDHHHDHNDHHDHTDHERSPSQEYGPPSTRNAISTEYGAPSGRNAANYERQTHKFPPPTVRVSFNQRFSSAASGRSNIHNSASNSISQGYADARSTNIGQGYAADRSEISQAYGPPETRSLSQEYGVPSTSARSLPDSVTPARNPAKEYIPVTRNSQKQSSPRDQNSLNQDYSVPKYLFLRTTQSLSALSRSNSAGYEASNPDSQSLTQSYVAPNNSPSSTYGAPFLSTTYGAPSTINFDSHSQDYSSISHSYNARDEKDLSETYGAPNVRTLSQEHGVSSTRSSPSSSYLPGARDDAPSQQYGVPDQDSQGYEQSRAKALKELLNQEPANYDFAYQIEDQESGSDFGHAETRQENRVEGSYFVVLPDGTRQTVQYEADERGFKPRISVESASNGYDDNAQELARSQGPY